MKNREAAIGSKMHVHDYLYAYVAKVAGERELILSNRNDIKILYFASEYCGVTDTPDVSIDKYIIECRFDDGRAVIFTPVSLIDNDVLGHTVYYKDASGVREISTVGPYEWDVIKPKIYTTFDEYFREINIALTAYDFLFSTKACDPFIANHYGIFFDSFRKFLYENYSRCESKYFDKSVMFDFAGEWSGSFQLREAAMMSKMSDGNLMLSRYSMN